jgi:hypothetical protein
MAHGEPTSAEVVAEFRARYLYSGNASAVAREMKMPERTGRTIASKLDADPTFAEESRALNARVLDRYTAIECRMVEKADDRFHEEWAPAVPGDRDPRPDNGRLILEGSKNALARAKHYAELANPVATGPAVVINLTGEATVEKPAPADGA